VVPIAAPAVDNDAMADTRVAVFVSGHTPPQKPFLAWASLVGDQVVLLHVPKNEVEQITDGTPCHCEIYEDGDAEQSIGATLRRTTVLPSAPPFAFLDTSSNAAVTEVSDPRFWSSDLDKVGLAMWEFVATEHQSDPTHLPNQSNATSAGQTSAAAVQRESSLGPQGPAAARPWWCKLFRSAPGC
jgi:hypothetical protein